MSIEFRWRVYCVTEGAYKYVDSVDVPTECPTNALHTINSTFTIIDDPNYVSKTQTNETLTVGNPADSTTILNFDIQGDANTTTTIQTNSTSNNVIVLPDASDTLIGRDTTDTLSNKSLEDATTFIVDETDNTKRLTFDVTGATTSTETTFVLTQTVDRTITFPDITDTLVSRTSADTLTNKTLTNPTISQILNNGTLVVPNLGNPTITDTILTANFAGTLANKNFIDASTYILDLTDNTKRIQFDAAGATGTTTILQSVPSINRTLVLPDASDILVARTTVDTLTNKTLTLPVIAQIVNVGTLSVPALGNPTLTDTLIARSTIDILNNKTLIDTTTAIADATDNTIRLKFDAAGTTGTSTTLLTSQTANRTVTIPDTNDTIVVTGTGGLSQTLTNKTLTLPVIAQIVNGGTLTLPTSTDVLVGRATTDTLTNKTLTLPTISTINNGGTITLPTGPQTLVGRTTADTLQNKILIEENSFFAALADTTKRLGFDTDGAATSTSLTLAAVHTISTTLTMPSPSPLSSTDFIVSRTSVDTLTNKTLTLPVISSISNVGTLALPTGPDTILGAASVVTLSNKSFYDNTTYIVDNLDVSKRFGWLLDGATTGTTFTLAAVSTVDTTMNLPVASPGPNDTIVARTSVDTLTNKTLTLPIIASVVNAGATITMPSTTTTLVGRTTSDTLQNKILIEGDVFFAPLADTTKRIAFDSTGATSTTTLTFATLNTISTTLTMPTPSPLVAADNVISRTSVDTLTNKTLTLPQITSVLNAGATITMPSTTTTLIGNNTTSTLTNKSLVDASTYIVDLGDPTRRLTFDIAGTTGTTVTIASVQTASSTLTLPVNGPPGGVLDTIVSRTSVDVLTNKTLTNPNISSISNSGTITLPTSTTTLVGNTTSDTLSNKSLLDTTTYIVDAGDNTKRLTFDVTGGTGVTTTLLSQSTVARTITLPDATTTLVGTNTTDTLTNKTLTFPVISTINNGGTITLPSGTDTIVARNTTDTLTNKTLTLPVISAIVNTGTLTLPTSTDTLVGRATTDTLLNKTMTDPSNNVVARALFSNSGANVVSVFAAANPTVGQVLMATGPTTATWQSAAGIAWQGPWDSGTTYLINDVVSINNDLYIAVATSTNQQPPNVTYWDLMLDGFRWRGTWSNVTTYDTNDLVAYSGGTYISIQGSNTNNIPSSSPLFWELFSGGGGGAASALGTTGADVNVNLAAPPVAGYVLTATSATTAIWQAPGWGNTLFVDAALGNNTTAARNGLPYLTITAAIAAAISGDEILVRAGTYSEILTLPNDITVRGIDRRRVIIQQVGVVADTTLITMGNSSCLENCTLNLTSTGHYTLRGVLYGGTSTASSIMRCVTLVVDNSTASDVGTSNVYGVHSTGTGTPGDVTLSLDNCNIQVKSAGLGNKRGILCDTGIHYLHAVHSQINTTVTTGAGSYIGVETNIANTRAVFTFCILGGDSADISQTLGTLEIPDTRLLHKTSNGFPISGSTSVQFFIWANEGGIANGTTYMKPGNGNTTNTEVYVRIAQTSAIKEMTMRATAPPGLAKVATCTIRKNGVDTSAVIQLVDLEVTKKITFPTITFADGDDMSVSIFKTNGAGITDVVLSVSLL